MNANLIKNEQMITTRYAGFSLRKALGVSFLAFLLVFTSACSSDKKKGSSTNRLNRTPVGDINNQPNSSSGWGAVSHNGMNVLRSFMYGVNDLTDVSTSMDDQRTGIRIRRSGNSIYILVWDEEANRSGQAYYWPLTIVQENANNGYLRAEDEVGTVEFVGQRNDRGMWIGQVRFNNDPNTNGASGVLGEFEMLASDLF